MALAESNLDLFANKTSMKLLNLKLKNFKGIKSFELTANGKNVNIYGDNGTGKTSIADASSWLLTGKDSEGKEKFDIKTLVNGAPVHNLEHEVEGTYNLNGNDFTLRRVYKEKWTRKRGSATEEFTGHTTDYFINDVPKSEADYNAFVAAIADEKLFKLLTSPLYFNQQYTWQERRKLLLEVCGDYTDTEVIASSKKLAKLPAILGNRVMDDHKEMVKAQLKKINDEIKMIPVRIDEATLALPDITGLSDKCLNVADEILKTDLQGKNEQLLQVSSGGEIARKKVEVQQIKAELQGIQNKHNAAAETGLSEKKKLRNELAEKVYPIDRAIGDKESTIEINLGRIEILDRRVIELRGYWYEVSEEKFAFSQETVCPTCNQSLPEELLSEARETALANFNQSKAERLGEISKQGKIKAEAIAEITVENKESQTKIDGLTEQQTSLKEQFNTVNDEINLSRAETISIESVPEYTEKQKSLVALEDEICNVGLDNAADTARLRVEIAKVKQEIEDNQQSLSMIKQHTNGQKRITELAGKEKTLAKEYGRLEEELFLCEEFTRTKVSMLEEKINSHFQITNFKLFETQVNGGIKECCETLVDGVPYGTGLNSGAKINAGIDQINTFSKHFGFIAPIIIDGRESVTRILDTEAQVISLFVCIDDKKLRIEVA